MKAVIQRVVNASVAGQYPAPYENSAEEVVDGQTISSIGKGLLVLVGIDKRMSTTVSPLLQEALALAFV
jgi:D-Tyr-tRNAtyr deacylase